jgi:hypothetical protein
MQRIHALTTALISLSLLGPLWAQNRPGPTPPGTTPGTTPAASPGPSTNSSANTSANQSANPRTNAGDPEL